MLFGYSTKDGATEEGLMVCILHSYMFVYFTGNIKYRSLGPKNIPSTKNSANFRQIRGKHSVLSPSFMFAIVQPMLFSTGIFVSV